MAITLLYRVILWEYLSWICENEGELWKLFSSIFSGTFICLNTNEVLMKVKKP